MANTNNNNNNNVDDKGEPNLALSLSLPTPHHNVSYSSSITPSPSHPPPTTLTPILINQDTPRSHSRRNNNPSSPPSTIEPPYPWSTNLRATIHPLSFLISHKITTISDTMQCRHCNTLHPFTYQLQPCFQELATFIRENKHAMHDRAPNAWLNPPCLTCPSCSQPKSLKPFISTKKRSINWLSLLLGQNLGFCTLEQLKYFCKHTRNHRTGAKDRVLYLTYLALCKQLDPSGPYNV
ncbi:Zinc finger RING/FYVE/PHD-type protein [Dioscorea alata]|uniref:Zinc finger RING/FYVE/PHD-type protein n=1 Tax=Dioscorea alata TaxID=55571 RepID=A0ACB7WK04_DIOAL|nr:Zinc finger RING/FYVE/PHD-type protein [Dioscorea alata]